MNLTEVATIPEIIDLEQDNKFSIDNTSIFYEYNGLIFSIEKIFDEYRDILFETTIQIELTEEEFNKFKYRPKYFCQTIYNNKDLWYLLLLINNMLSVTEFNRKIINIFPISKITEIINDIIEKEKLKERNMLIKVNTLI